ncbi:MAG: transporter, family, D-galactonate transporter [Bryobacterales bacterium]|nr:transporter, family, D-galactonate transporter [Bryobacterales bacterium]
MASVAPSSRLARAALSRRQWIFLILLVISICISYIDRGSLSVADKYLQTEFSLDPQHRGMIYSAFFWSYAPALVLAGWLVDRFDVNRVLAAGFIVWSIATLLTGAANGFLMLFCLRMLLGMGESVAYPAYSRILAGNFKEEQRGFANAAIDAGSKLGPALGILVGGLLMASYGWRVFFVVTGVLSLMWLVPWFMWAPKGRTLMPPKGGKVPGFAEILSKRAAWGTFIGLFCGNYVWYFIITWLPSYFRDELHFDQRQMAVFASAPLWVLAASALTSGMISDRWIASGASPNLVRKTFTGLGLGLSTIMFASVLTRNPMSSLVVLCCACLAYGLYSSNLWAITQTLAGPWAAGRWTGLQNAFGNVSGIVAPWLTGWIVQETGQFYWAFVVTTAMLVIGTVCFTVVIPKVEPANWQE